MIVIRKNVDITTSPLGPPKCVKGYSKIGYIIEVRRSFSEKYKWKLK